MVFGNQDFEEVGEEEERSRVWNRADLSSEFRSDAQEAHRQKEANPRLLQLG